MQLDLDQQRVLAHNHSRRNGFGLRHGTFHRRGQYGVNPEKWHANDSRTHLYGDATERVLHVHSQSHARLGPAHRRIRHHQRDDAAGVRLDVVVHSNVGDAGGVGYGNGDWHLYSAREYRNRHAIRHDPRRRQNDQPDSERASADHDDGSAEQSADHQTMTCRIPYCGMRIAISSLDVVKVVTGRAARPNRRYARLRLPER